MVLGTFDQGDTIQPVVKFRDWAELPAVGALIDPASVVVTLYDSDQNNIGTLVAVHETTGIYHADWTLPDTPGTYYIEFKGIIAGEPAIDRASVKVKFIV